MLAAPLAATTTEPAELPFSPRELRDCFGAFVTGVTVITTVDEQGRRHGLTVNSFSSVSLEPPLVLWSQRLQAASYPIFQKAKHFGVNILAEDQIDISRRFATSSSDKFADVDIFYGFDDLPLLAGCSAYLECLNENQFIGGDHAIFLGRVVRIKTTGRLPLAFGGGQYKSVQPHQLA